MKIAEDLETDFDWSVSDELTLDALDVARFRNSVRIRRTVVCERGGPIRAFRGRALSFRTSSGVVYTPTSLSFRTVRKRGVIAVFIRVARLFESTNVAQKPPRVVEEASLASGVVRITVN